MKQLVNNFRRYLKLFFCLLRVSVMETLAYRTSGLLLGITPIVWMATNLIFLSVLFGGVKEIGGWSRWEMMLLLGIHEVIFLLTWMFFAGNLEKFVDDVRLGSFDRTLLKPANHRFLVSFNAVDLTALGSLINSIVILSIAFSKLSLNFTFVKTVCFFVSFFSAVIIVYLIYFLVASLCLFFTKAEIFLDWFLEMTDFDRYPADIYGNGFRRFLFFGLPILFFAYVPTAILLDKIPLIFTVYGLLIILWLYFLSTIFWRVGLKRYQSASS